MVYFYFITAQLTAILSLASGILVIRKNKEEAVNRSWSLLCLFVFIWSFGLGMVFLSQTKTEAFFWSRFSHLGAIIIPVLYLRFTFDLLQVFRKQVLYICYLLTIFLYSISLSSLFIKDMVPRYIFHYYNVPGPCFIIFTLFFLLTNLYSIGLLIKVLLKSKGIFRIQLNYVLIGSLIGLGGGSTTFFLVFNIPIPPFGLLGTAIYTLIYTYAMVKYRLMDISIVIRKTAIYSIVATIITLAYFILIYVTETIFRGFMGYKSIPWTLGVIVLFTLIFQPLKDAVQIFVDKIFFKDSRVLLQEELKRTQEELRRAERLKAVGTLAAGMAHEIKNPLTSIKTFTEHLRQKKDDPEFINKFERIVGSEVDKINKIVRQLLDFAKPAPLKLEICNVNSLLEDILSLLSNDILRYRIELNKEYSEIPNVHADINQLKQAFLNILLNAIEAMKDGGKLTVITEAETNEIKINVIDTGKGISQKDLDHIFDPFYTTKSTGIGLGMSIVYGIIKAHNGNITLESEENKGTVVKIRFPV